MTTREVLERLQGVKRSNGGWVARCPAHDDKEPSLKISEGSDGRTLMHCHAGCALPSVVGAIGLSETDLFLEKHANGNGRRTPVATYEYTDEQDKTLYHVDRFEWIEHGERKKACIPRRPDGRKTLEGVRRVPYRLPELRRAVQAQETLIACEGENKVEALRAQGFNATTTGSATSWRSEYAEHFKGARVLLWPDADEPGEKYIAAVARDLEPVAAEIRVLRIHGAKDGDDAVDFFQNGGTAEQLDNLIASAPTYAVAATPEPPSTAPRRLKRLLEGAAPTPPRLHINNFLLADDVNVLGGDGDAGKSTTMFAAAPGQRVLCIARACRVSDDRDRWPH